MCMGNTRILLVLSLLMVATPVIADESGPSTQRTVSAPAQQMPIRAVTGLERAEGERLAEATGHYARTRSLIIAAIREFDKAAALASPDALIDSQEWRRTLVDRAQDLEKVLDPQPRASRGGVKFDADTRLLNEAAR